MLKPKIASVSICPKCGGNDVRLSSHAKWRDRFHAPLGQRALRCRTCGVRFYASPDPAHVIKTAAPKHIKRSHKSEGKRGRKRFRRWVVEAIIFVVLLLLFWLFLKYLTKEPPASSTVGSTTPRAGQSRI
jgi:hypothetical protein